MRNILLNFHIFKNAGITIEWILENNFKNKFTMTKYGTNLGKIYEPEFLLNFFKKNPNIIAFSSHQIRPLHPNSTEINFLPILALRHPIDRIFSMYSFMRRKKLKNKNDEKIASSNNISDYLKWSLYESENKIVKNSQFRFLTQYSHKLDSEKMFFAKNLIKNCPFLVVVDKFDESMLLGEKRLKPYFENLDFSYIKQNYSPERESNLTQRLESARNEIGVQLMDELIENNKLDMELYLFAKKQLEVDISQIKNFDLDLQKYKEICRMQIQSIPKSTDKKILVVYDENENEFRNFNGIDMNEF